MPDPINKTLGEVDDSSLGEETPSQLDPVALKSHLDRVLSEKKKLYGKNKDLETQLQHATSKLGELEVKDLETKGDTQKLLEIERQKAANAFKTIEELNGKLTQKEHEEINRQKFVSVISSFEGGLDKRWYPLIDFDEIAIDENGQVDKGSVEIVVKRIKDTYPETARGQMAGVPRNAPSTGTGQVIAYADWLKLTFKDKQKWSQSQIK